MSDLIGYKDSAKRIAGEAVEHFTSTAPYWGFSVWGARRSGRSIFFAELREIFDGNETLPINCFVGDLAHATPEGFEQALLESIETGNRCSHDYSPFQGKVRLPEEFFVLCSKLYENEKKLPVFLIDMGKSLEEAYDKRGMDGVIDLSRLLKKIYNLLKDKNISLILGLGLTPHFVREAESFAADVFVERYEPVITLKNTSLEGESPRVAFQQIVKRISGLDIPDRYQGLWRGDIVTAGELGENFKSSETREVTNQSLWHNLRGQWDILGNIQLGTIPPTELSELVLADAVIGENRYPDYLESCDNGYRASDKLYETFGFCSPRRDPGTAERIRRRVDDPDDDAVVGDLLSSIGKVMSELGLSEISEPNVLGLKSALMEAQVNDYFSSDLSELEKELYQTALPRKLVSVAFLTPNPVDEILQGKLKEYAEQNCFILILHREGVDPGRIPLGRYIAENIKSAHKEPISLEEITGFLNGSNKVLQETVNNWIRDTVENLFNKKPPLCIGHPTVKQLISGTISSGTVSIDSFAEQKNISKADANKLINALLSPPILAKKKGMAIWDPDNDVILKTLLENAANEEKINARIKTLYTTNQVNIAELASLYQCITGHQGLSGLTKDNILKHVRGNHNYQLKVIEKCLESEPDLAPEYFSKFETYRKRELNEIEDINPYRTDILKLLEEVQNAKENIAKERDRNQKELSKKKEELNREIEALSDYFSDEEKSELLHVLETIRSLTSHSFDQTKRKIAKRKARVDEVKNARNKLSDRFYKLQDFKNRPEYGEIKDGLEKIQDLITEFDLDDAENQIQAIDAKLIELTRLKEQRDILAGPVGPPPVGAMPGKVAGPVGPPPVGAMPGKAADPVGPPEKSKIFDLSKREEQKELAEMLTEHKGKITKIDVQVDL